MPTLSRRTQAAPAARGDEGSREQFWPTEWLLWETPRASGVENMASDLALLRRAAVTGRAVLRFYDWARPTLSFGRHEAARDRWDVSALEAADVDLVRRPTGGRALLHAHEVTWSVTLPLAADVPWRRVYDAVNARLLRALHRVGVQASLMGNAGAPRVVPDGPLCFDAPGAGELTIDGRKLAGSAVWRADGAYLQHGSILMRDVQQVLTSFRRPSAATPHVSLSRRMETPALHGASADALREAMRAEWCAESAATRGDANRMPPRDIPAFKPSTEHTIARDASRLELSSADWLWRR